MALNSSGWLYFLVLAPSYSLSTLSAAIAAPPSGRNILASSPGRLQAANNRVISCSGTACCATTTSRVGRHCWSPSPSTLIRTHVRKMEQLWRSNYLRLLEEEVARLRAENRALMNSLLGTAGFPPVEFPEASKPQPLLRLRKRSWHQLRVW